MKTERKTLKDMQDYCNEHHNGSINEKRVCIINQEFQQGFDFMKSYPKSVTFFGSARLALDHPAAQQAMSLAGKLAQAGYTIVTGGGDGIMEAANKGAYDAGGHSVGISVQLPKEQVTNDYVTDAIDFHHLFSRKVTLAYSAEAYVYFAGGFGTLDELFEVLTLKQTHKIAPVPIILVGTSFWEPLKDFIQKVLVTEGTINQEDTNLFIITDDEDLVVETIKAAPIREEIDIHH